MNARVQAADGCPADAINKLAAFLGLARRYVSAAEDELRSLSALKVRERRARWTGGRSVATSLQHWFGPYSDARFRFVARVFAESRKRLHEGFDFGGKRQPMRIKCLSQVGTRCEKRRLLLANASQFGTIRVCPRLLSKPLEEGAMTMLHESLHQFAGVDDQRAKECSVGSETRCYRDGARALVRGGKFSKALRNNDNYVSFARAVHEGRTASAGPRKRSEMGRANFAHSRRDDASDMASNAAVGSCGCKGKCNCEVGGKAGCGCGGNCKCAKCQAGQQAVDGADMDADENHGIDALDDDDEALDEDDDEALDEDDDEALDEGDEALDEDDEALDEDDEALDEDDEALDEDDEALDEDDEALDAMDDDDDDDDEALDDDDDALDDDALDKDDLSADSFEDGDDLDADDLSADDFDADDFEYADFDDADDADDADDDNENDASEGDDELDDDDDLDREDVYPSELPKQCSPSVWKVIVRKDQSGKTPFPETHQKALCDAVKLARDWAKYARCVFDKIWNEKRTGRQKNAWENNAAISTYMGERRLSREAIRKVRLRVQRISQKLSRWTVRFIYIQHMEGFRSYKCDTITVPGGAYAYSSPSAGVKLCPLFFTDFKMTPETRAMTIIHELVHTLGWGIHYKIPGGERVVHGFDLFAKDLINKKTEDLAKVRPWRARRNAANYATMMYALFRQSGANPCPPK